MRINNSWAVQGVLSVPVSEREEPGVRGFRQGPGLSFGALLLLCECWVMKSVMFWARAEFGL